MAEDRQSTPEKQLLRLIEGSGKRAPHLTPASLGSAAVGVWAFLKRSLRGKRHGLQAFSLASVNKVLTAAVVAFCLYIFADSLISTVHLFRPVALDLNASVPAPAPIASSLNNEAYYTGKFFSRDIFSARGAASVSNGPAQPDPNAMMADLSLVGIAWSAKPEVIIENKSKQRTFFLKEGQSLVDGVLVQKVFRDHAVLSYNGQEFELR